MDGLIYKVCSIKKEIETWKFYDLEGKQLREPSENTYFPSSMNRRYRAKRKGNAIDEDISCVWFLIGKKNNASRWVQVGRTSNITNMLSNDIKNDIKEFYSGHGRYGELQKKYTELIFYEVDIEKYIKTDTEALKILGTSPIDMNLRMAYFINCAAYIEGKMAFEHTPDLYNPSILDGCYYRYFKDKK